MNAIKNVRVLYQKYKEMPVGVKASIWYTICSIVQKCIVFLTLPIFTRLLTDYQYGQYSVYQSWMSIVIIFSTLNLQYGSFDTAMVKFEDDRDTYISSIQGLCTILTLSMFVVYCIAPAFWNRIFKLPTILMVAMFAEMLFTTVVAFWTNKERFVYRYKPMIIVTIIISILSPLVGLVGVMSVEEKGVARILGNVVVYICIGSIFYVYHLIKGKKFYHREYWKYVLKFNVPLIPYYLSQMIFSQSDRIMIDNLCGTDKVALYSVAFQFSIILSFVTNAINSSFVPWTFGNIKKRIFEPIKRTSNMLVLMLAVMLILLVLFGPEAILILAGKKYYEAIWVIPPVAGSLLFLFLSQLSINVMFYFEDNISLVKGSIISAVLNVALNSVCIQYFGYVAAGYTTLLCYIVFWICNVYYMNKACQRNIENYHNNMLYDFSFLIKLSTVFVLILIALTFTYPIIWIRYLLIGCILIGMFIYRNNMIEFLKVLKTK